MIITCQSVYNYPTRFTYCLLPIKTDAMNMQVFVYHNIQVIKTFSTQEGCWYIGIKGDGGVKSKGTRLLIEKEK